MTTLKTLLSACCLFAAIHSCTAIFCTSCNPAQCEEPVNCTAGTVIDTCGCCHVCAIPYGESCSTEEFGLCADGRFCLPDGGLFSESTTGKCLDITDCFSSGCEIVGETCECGYSNSCPTKHFTFDDLVTCETTFLDLEDNSTNTTEAPEVSCQDPCNLELCVKPVKCSAGTVRDSCNCCEVCAVPLGGVCITDSSSSQCGQGHVCVADGAESSLGTCQDISTCQTFGCEIFEEQCRCNFSNSCPMQTFTYSTMDECEVGLKASACEDVECMPHINCTEGMYYEPGPQLPGECCPSDGVCWCDTNLCPNEPDCPDDYEPIIVTAANNTDGECCDTYECKPVQCEFNNQTLAYNETVKPDDCTTCKCFEGEVICATLYCYEPNCNELEELVVVPGHCCPFCRPREIVEPPPSPICKQEGEFVDLSKPCLLCSCYEGRTSCVEQICPPSECVDPVFLSGTCCPVCESASTEPPTKEPSTTDRTTPVVESATEVTTETDAEEPTIEKDTTDSVTEQSTVSTESVTTYEPFYPKACKSFQRYRSPDNFCLICMCIRGVERCMDNRKTLCGEPQCENPIRIEGECCPVCRIETLPPHPTHIVVGPEGPESSDPPTSPVLVITTVVDANTVEGFENVQELADVLDKEVAKFGYTLIDVQEINLGKTQSELILAITRTDKFNLPINELGTVLSARLSTVMNKPRATVTENNNFPRIHQPVSNNVVIIVSVVSVLVAIIVVTVFGIFIVSVLVSRQNKKRKDIRKV